MDKKLSTLKGIHPGIYLERELKNKSLAKGLFAISLGEYPQTLTAITKGRRSMNTSLALKIETALNMEEGYLMILQVYYDINEEKRKQSRRPNIDMFRRVLFWDTDINKIDWQKQKRAVINRVFKRGNDLEKAEVTRFYGAEIVESILAKNS